MTREWALRWGRKIGGWWMDGCYFADEMYRYTKHVMNMGGVVTWDVPIDKAGAIPESFVRQLRQLPGRGEGR